MEHGLQVFVKAHPWSDGFDVYVLSKRSDGNFILNGDVWSEAKEGDEHKPTFRLTSEMAKLLTEALLSKGVRPDEESRNEGRLEATRYHLEDLRKMLKLVK